MLKKITNDNYQNEVVESKNTVLLDFWASWCGPCRMLSPVIDEIAKDHPEITVGKVNIDEEPALAQAYNIMSVPSLIVVKNGQIVNQSVGFIPKKQIETLINNH